MKFLHLEWAKNHTVRLAITYLLIMIAMSVSFSAALYAAAGASLPNADSIKVQAPTGAGSPGGQHTVPKRIPQADTVYMHAQLQKLLDEVRTTELRRLIALNVLILFVGGGFSYFLARRTLRPIETALSEQSRFASDASHELRTPLTVMQTANERALRLLQPTDEMQAVLHENLGEIARLRGLAASLLRLSDRGDRLALRPVSVFNAASAAAQQVSKCASPIDITIDEALVSVVAMADEEGLVQVFSILLENAVAYSPPNSAVKVRGYQSGRHVYVYVQDTGFGIEPADLPRIFDRFYRTDQSRRRKPSGHGLGLAIAKRLVVQQGGHIAASSLPGEGSTFSIRLTAAKGS